MSSGSSCQVAVCNVDCAFTNKTKRIQADDIIDPIWRTQALHRWVQRSCPLGMFWVVAENEFPGFSPRDQRYFIGYSDKEKFRKTFPNNPTEWIQTPIIEYHNIVQYE